MGVEFLYHRHASLGRRGRSPVSHIHDPDRPVVHQFRVLDALDFSLHTPLQHGCQMYAASLEVRS